MNKIGIGTAQFGMPYGISNVGGQTTSLEVEKILDFSKKHNIHIIDTAFAYGNAEEVLGKNDLSSFKVVSKFMPSATHGNIASQFEESISRLNLSSLYGYLAHRPLELLKDEGQWASLLDLKHAGKIKKIGYSLNSPGELEQLVDFKMFPDLIQVPYNLFDTRFRDYMIWLKGKGCEIHTRSTFLQGLFFMDPNELDEFFDEVKESIATLNSTFSKNLSGVLLKYVLNLEFVDVVILGIENQLQLLENISALDNPEELRLTIPRIPHISENILMPSLWPKL